MQQEILLLLERLVVAVEGLSGNSDRMTISLCNISTDISYLVAEKRHAEVSDTPSSSNNTEHADKVSTDSPPAMFVDEQLSGIGSANSRSSGDEDKILVNSEDGKPKDEQSLCVKDATYINTHGSDVFTSSSSNRNESVQETNSVQKFDESTESQVQEADEIIDPLGASTYEPSFDDSAETHLQGADDISDPLGASADEAIDFQSTIKNEPLYVGEDWSSNLKRSCENAKFGIEEVCIAEARPLLSITSIINISHEIDSPGPSSYHEHSLSINTLEKVEDPKLKEEFCLEGPSEHESADKEMVNDPLGISPSFTAEEMKTEYDENAPKGSLIEQMELESESECRDVTTKQSGVRTREGSHGTVLEGFALQTDSSQNEEQDMRKKLFFCEICGKCFRDKHDSKRHMRVHTGEKPFKCSVCGRAFADKCNLNTHMHIHTGDHRFKCPVCGKPFSIKSSLISHMRIHTGERPFKCPVCAKTFVHNSRFTKHKLLHTGQKPHKCKVCDKAFAESGTLKTHMRRHTGVKPFKCSVCEKSFVQSSALHTHMLTHAKELPLMCKICKKYFRETSHLYRHFHQMHTIALPASSVPL